MGVNIQTIKDIRFYLTQELEKIYQEPELSAIINIVIKTVPGISKLPQLYLADKTVSHEQALRIIDICKDLQSGKPIQYVLGETIFYDCIIKVNSSVLIPRPETEELVHLIINENSGYDGNIIDFGTGSGCIAIALAGNIPGAKITGLDISEDALDLARENALLNNVRVSFIKNDILDFQYNSVSETGIIVSNPPYVRNSEKQSMSSIVLDFEPHSALFVHDSDPLVFYRAILHTADKILISEGRVYFEINEALGNPMRELLNFFGYTDVKVITDINNKERIIKGIKNG